MEGWLLFHCPAGQPDAGPQAAPWAPPPDRHLKAARKGKGAGVGLHKNVPIGARHCSRDGKRRRLSFQGRVTLNGSMGRRVADHAFAPHPCRIAANDPAPGTTAVSGEEAVQETGRKATLLAGETRRFADTLPTAARRTTSRVPGTSAPPRASRRPRQLRRNRRLPVRSRRPG